MLGVQLTHWGADASLGGLPDWLPCVRCFFSCRAPGVCIDSRPLNSSEQPETSPDCMADQRKQRKIQTHYNSEESTMQCDGKDGTVQKFLITMNFYQKEEGVKHLKTKNLSITSLYVVYQLILVTIRSNPILIVISYGYNTLFIF